MFLHVDIADIRVRQPNVAAVMPNDVILSKKLFPSAEVESALRTALLESVVATAAIYGTALPEDPQAQSAASVQLDSLDVVGMLCRLEPLVGYELKDSLVRTGGYRSVNDAMGQLMPRIQASWDKQASKVAKK
jgi:hypothetical protein